ncbi:MAG: methyltransferase [Myxococcales bacterium]|nr:methyltransferase [Myxococcales bacterium]
MVPHGQVSTYGQIATYLGSPRVARHVGWALASLTETDRDVPWHRVINSRGFISGRGQSVRAELQKNLLEVEGVLLSDQGRIDLSRFLWTMPRPA